MDCERYRDDMMDVLYGEASPAAAARYRAHAADCADCREEASAFAVVRQELGTWTAPPPPRILARPAARRRAGPAWLAAAAALLVGVGGTLALSGAGRDEEAIRRLLAEQDARHQAEIRSLRAALAAGAVPSTVRPAAAPALDREALLAEVRGLIEDSEKRQAVVLTAGLRDLAERTEARRQYDLARVSAGLSYLEGKNGLEVARTTELMGHVLRASQQK